MRISLNRIKKDRAFADKAVERLAGKMVRIWSGEHGAWWRPNRSGYTRVEDDAGIYPAVDALGATHHCGPEKRIVYETVTP